MKRSVLKILGYTFLTILIIIALLWFALQVPRVQNFISDKILSSLSEQYDADFQIGNIKIDFMDEVIIDDLLFKDQLGDTLLMADKLEVDIGLLNLFGKQIRLDEIKLTNVYSHIYSKDDTLNFNFLIPAKDTTIQTPPKQSAWDISLGMVAIDNIRVNYDENEQLGTLDAETIKAQFTTSDFDQQVLQFSMIALDKFDVNFKQIAGSEPKENTVFKFPDLGWEIGTEVIRLTNSNVELDLNGDPIGLTGLDVEMNDVHLDEKKVTVDVEKLNLTYNDKLEIVEFESEVNLRGDSVEIRDLVIATPYDNLSASSLLYMINSESLSGQTITANIDDQTLMQLESFIPKNINLKPGSDLNLTANSLVIENDRYSTSNLSLSYGNIIDARGNVTIRPKGNDNMYIQSELGTLNLKLNGVADLFNDFSLPDSLEQYENLSFSGKVAGDFDSLHVENVAFKIDDVLDFNGDGNVTSIRNVEDLNFNLNIDFLTAEISKLPIPKNDEIALDSLGKVNYTGQISGNLDAIKIDGILNTNLGSLASDISLTIPENVSNLGYEGSLELKEFDLGTLLKNDDLNKISLSTTLEGNGLDFNNLNAGITGVISDFEYKGYTYADVEIDATLKDRIVDGKVRIDDENVRLSYDGKIQLDTATTIFNFTATIDTLNLEALGLYNHNVSLSGVIKSKIRMPLRQGEKGSIDITNLLLTNENDQFQEDSIGIRATKTSDSTFVIFDSDFAKLEMAGKFGVRDIPASIGDLVDYYINLDTSFVHIEDKSQSLAIDGIIRTLKPINILLPNLDVQAKAISLRTTFDFSNNAVDGAIGVDSLFVENFFSESLNLNVDSESDQLMASLKGNNNSYSGIDIPILNLTNKFSVNSLETSFEAADTDKLPKLRFGLTTNFNDEFTEISLSDSLVLNKKDWSASKDNSIKIFPDKLLIENLALTDNNEYLTINSTGENDENLNLEFKNFNIGQFTTLLTSEPSKLRGNIDGTVDLLDINTDMYYLINLDVDEMYYDSTFVGILSIDADDDQQSGVLTTSVSLVGPSNDVNGGGTFDPGNQKIDFDLNIEQFEMMLLDPFLSQFIKDSEGVVAGRISVDGTSELPQIDGELTLQKVITTIVVNNTRYGVGEHTFTLDNNSIDLGLLDIYDANNNVATISGTINHSYLQDITLDLNLQTDQFTFLNTSVVDNPVFYGKLLLGADVELTGPVDLLDVNVIASTLDSTEVTISPFSIEKFLLEEDFITYGKPSDFEELTNEYLLKIARQFPFKVNILLNASQEAKMNFVVDPVTGDKIEGRGNGDLRIILYPDGQQEIFGTYTVTDGAYTFSYGDFVSKDFKVKPGGTVRFNGNPLEAVLNIDAIYSVYTTTYELIKNEIAADENEVAAAQRRTNVDVFLNLKGTLDQPSITLDIRVPDLQSSNLISTVERKLAELRNNPNELNNQVFGLLLFNSFILSDNVASSFGNVGSNIALSSISSLISNQLNNLADKVIKGVDVDINFNSYDSNFANEGAGGRVTEVGLKVSKQLFDERLSISAGGNFDLSGQQGTEPYSSLIGDFVLEYKLTENGRYRIRVFSKTDYDRLLNENTNRNGVSLYFNKSFDSKLDD